MKTKLEMAHEWYMMQTRRNGCALVADAWKYADAMQAAADERKPSEFPNVLRGACGEIVAVKVDDIEWQPDWSQAPEWANWWVAVANQSGKITGGWFYDVEPEFGESKGVSIYYSSNSNNILTDSFGYTGDWRESLRKRPK